jgi:hypothetical protein
VNVGINAEGIAMPNVDHGVFERVAGVAIDARDVKH